MDSRQFLTLIKGFHVKRSTSQKVLKSKGLQVKWSPVKRSTKIQKYIYLYIYTHKTNINERIIIQKFIDLPDP